MCTRSFNPWIKTASCRFCNKIDSSRKFPSVEGGVQIWRKNRFWHLWKWFCEDVEFGIVNGYYFNLSFVFIRLIFYFDCIDDIDISASTLDKMLYIRVWKENFSSNKTFLITFIFGSNYARFIFNRFAGQELTFDINYYVWSY